MCTLSWSLLPPRSSLLCTCTEVTTVTNLTEVVIIVVLITVGSGWLNFDTQSHSHMLKSIFSTCDLTCTVFANWYCHMARSQLNVTVYLVLCLIYLSLRSRVHHAFVPKDTTLSKFITSGSAHSTLYCSAEVILQHLLCLIHKQAF